jgi:xanthosine utilization system XapX-like protein
MRIFGAILILLGILLCLTIFLAPLGGFLILVGLICVVVGRRNRTVINNVVQVSSAPNPSFQQANIADVDDRKRASRALEPPMFADQERRQATPPLIDVTPHQPPTYNGFAYDKAKWQMLVRYDADISRIVDVLAPYGQKYVDELAAAYLALNDKTYLPMIIQKIVGSAKQDAANARTQSAGRV